LLLLWLNITVEPQGNAIDLCVLIFIRTQRFAPANRRGAGNDLPPAASAAGGVVVFQPDG